MSALFEARQLRKSFGGVTVADDISLALGAGDRVALIGPNGAGKTTFINLVTGNLKADSGTVWIAGEDMTRRDDVARARRGLVRSFQISRLFHDMTPAEHVAMAILQREGRALRMVGEWSAMPDVVSETEAMLATVGLSTDANRQVGAIAYGQKRLLELALALALRPRILLLDEPAAGLPQGERARIAQVLDSLPVELAVLVIDHDMDLVFRFARRIVVLAAGRIIFDGPPDEARQSRRVREAYLGDAA